MPSINQWFNQLQQSAQLPWQERVAALSTLFKEANTAFSTSLSAEDQLITHLIARERAQVRVFTLDTGRLFEETLALQQQTERYYGLTIHTYYPDAQALENYVRESGINGFYDSVEKRRQCCAIRKVEPLRRALGGVDIWISGLRREHSENRQSFPIAEWDDSTATIKYYPLIDVTEAELLEAIATHHIPVNPLHEKGYPSIGCAPCTRAIAPGEHPRAGRWWWEQANAQECGLHFSNGKLVRRKQKEPAGKELSHA